MQHNTAFRFAVTDVEDRHVIYAMSATNLHPSVAARIDNSQEDSGSGSLRRWWCCGDGRLLSDDWEPLLYWRLSLWTEYIDLSQEIACSWWLINALAHTYIYSWHWWNEDMDNSSKIWGGLEPVISSQCCRMFTYFFETSCKVAYRLLVAVFSLRSLQHQRKPSYQLYCHHQCMAYRHRFLFRHSASQFSHYKWRKRLPNYVYI